ncbi:homoserine/homoserine lactone efflux protein [Propionivibrio sp.]|uniref:homoserine/homoserine lactone efflux protein n=1 Tax=Propionivibrio sp. TaxID=2212460 RepID=UPI00272E6205|nr:homoserine/homoserine lactone efflux protein [Propionivibrio sp.]
MALSTWLAFLLAAILIAVSPGPGAATSMSVGLRHGYLAALRAIGGLQAALLIQLGIVFAGLGALLMASTTAFEIMKFVGAGYLVWLGIQKWREIPHALDDTSAVNRPNGLFLQGLLVNLTNPKAIVFMAALTPQFIDPARSQWLQFLILSATMCGVDTLVMSGYALLASRLRRWLRDLRAMKAQNRFFGGVFVGAGVLLATTSRN